MKNPKLKYKCVEGISNDYYRWDMDYDGMHFYGTARSERGVYRMAKKMIKRHEKMKKVAAKYG